jgi:hypothetical protein
VILPEALRAIPGPLVYRGEPAALYGHAPA